MDISILSQNCIKLKGKKAIIIVDPEKQTPKTSADAILLTGIDFDTSRISDSRVILNGPGEYEIKGSKISGAATPKYAIYKLLMDNISIILGKPVDFSKLESNFTACDVAVLNADHEFNESFVTALSPKMVVLYGEKKLDGAKKLGAKNLAPEGRLSVAKDKLPEKTEIIVLASS
ncbi:MAG: hypothetical protein AAB583_04415 [Patescibacteria group bacterium]